ncbi:hypothetical protein PGB90_004220 [Kerria lacca]
MRAHVEVYSHNKIKNTIDFKQELQEKLLLVTLKLTKSLYSESTSENILFSPLNMYIVLSLCRFGASGTTREEISHFLELPSNENLILKIHEDLTNIIKSMENTKAADVSLANGMFVRKLTRLNESFLELTRKYYGNEIFNVHFENGGSTATDYINKWIFNKTKGRIVELFKEQLPSDTKILLASSLYFGTKWIYPFDIYKTTKETFNKGSEIIDVDMMRNKKQLLYVNNERKFFESITIPYEGQKFVMHLILPYTSQSLENIIKYFTVDDLRIILKKEDIFSTYVDYKIPRMKFSWSKSIKKQLKKLGVRKLFENANLNNMVTSADLQVTEITQAAEMECDENGIIASVATALEYEPYSGITSLIEPVNFFVNRSFLFFITHRETSTLLFVGVVNKPVD